LKPYLQQRSETAGEAKETKEEVEEKAVEEETVNGLAAIEEEKVGEAKVTKEDLGIVLQYSRRRC